MEIRREMSKETNFNMKTEDVALSEIPGGSQDTGESETFRLALSGLIDLRQAPGAEQPIDYQNTSDEVWKNVEKEEIVYVDEASKHDLLGKDNSSTYTPCEVCKKFISKKNYNRHLNMHTDGYKCSVCEYVSKSAAYTRKHFQRYHATKEERTKPICKFCGMIFSDSETLQDHTIMKHVKLEMIVERPLGNVIENRFENHKSVINLKCPCGKVSWIKATKVQQKILTQVKVPSGINLTLPYHYVGEDDQESACKNVHENSENKSEENDSDL